MRYILLTILSLILMACEHEDDENSLPDDQVIVYIDDMAIQCESPGLSEIETAQQLIDVGIDIIASMCGSFTAAVITICGAQTTGINLHIINIQNVVDAQELGFEPVSSLIVENDRGYDIIRV